MNRGECCLARVGKGFSKPDGSGELGIIGIGESLGSEEVWSGLPFRPKAQAGSKLNEILELAGLPREKILLWNLIACQPPDNDLKGYDDAIDHCKVYFDRVVFGVKPAPAIGKRVIIAFGSKPLSSLVSGMGGVSEVRGFVHESIASREDIKGNGSSRGNRYGLVIGTYHPSFIKRGNPELTPLAAFDIQRAIATARGEFRNYPAHPDYEEPEINTHPTRDEGWAFYNYCKDNPRRIIYYDIETPRSKWIPEDERDTLQEGNIIQIQFCTGKGDAIVFPWKEPFITISRSIFLLPTPKANQFAYGFDNPRLKAAGVVMNGPLHDIMWMFKTYQPRLPRNLQSMASMAGFPFPWKQMADSEPEYYGGCDVIADAYVMEWLVPRMKQLGVWRGYLDQIFSMYTILGPRMDGSRESASDRGLPVDNVAREALKVQLVAERAEKDKELQKLIPDELKNITPKRKQENGAIDYGYIREPKEVKEAREVYEGAVEERVKKGITKYPTFDEWVRSKYGFVEREITGVDGETGEIVTIKRWCKIRPFVSSNDQMVRYLEYKKSELEGS